VVDAREKLVLFCGASGCVPAPLSGGSVGPDEGRL
jgi:hypothetical protein